MPELLSKGEHDSHRRSHKQTLEPEFFISFDKNSNQPPSWAPRCVTNVTYSISHQRFGRDTQLSYMKYEDALALFLAYNPESTPLHTRLKTERKHFKELLCHPKFGLCVYIVLEQFIVLKSDETDLEKFFYDFLKSLQEQDKIDRLCIDNDFITKLLDTVDTEWDRQLIYVLLGASRSRKELSGLGIDSDNICSLTENVVSIIEERNNAKMAAKDMVALRLKSKTERIEEKVVLKKNNIP